MMSNPEQTENRPRASVELRILGVFALAFAGAAAVAACLSLFAAGTLGALALVGVMAGVAMIAKAYQRARYLGFGAVWRLLALVSLPLSTIAALAAFLVRGMPEWIPTTLVAVALLIACPAVLIDSYRRYRR